MKITRCARCALHASRTRIVNGEGHPGASIAFVGEAPGAQEDAAGRPFVGRAGRFFDASLRAAGLAREEVFVTNAVRCRPPRNRRPKPEEVLACRDYLLSELNELRPRVVVTLGSVAHEAVTGRRGRLAEMVGRPLEMSIGPMSVTVVPNYHPAAAMRNREMRVSFERAIRMAGELAVSGQR